MIPPGGGRSTISQPSTAPAPGSMAVWAAMAAQKRFGEMILERPIWERQPKKVAGYHPFRPIWHGGAHPGQIGDNGEDWRDGIQARVVRRCACTTVHACRRTTHMCWSQRERAPPALLHCAGPWLDDKHRAVLAGLRRRRRCPPVSWQPWSTAATVAADATWHCSQMVIAAHALLTTTARALTCCTLSSHADGPRDHPEACPVYPCGRRALPYSGTR